MAFCICLPLANDGKFKAIGVPLGYQSLSVCDKALLRKLDHTSCYGEPYRECEVLGQQRL